MSLPVLLSKFQDAAKWEQGSARMSNSCRSENRLNNGQVPTTKKKYLHLLGNPVQCLVASGRI